MQLYWSSGYQAITSSPMAPLSSRRVLNKRPPGQTIPHVRYRSDSDWHGHNGLRKKVNLIKGRQGNQYSPPFWTTMLLLWCADNAPPVLIKVLCLDGQMRVRRRTLASVGLF
jgi:hypothetical protein